MRSFLLPGAVLLSLAAPFAAATAAPMTPYLVGAQIYDSGNDGSNVGGPYQFSTNSATSHAGLIVNGTTYADTISGDGASNFAIPLSLGDNTFTFSSVPGYGPASIVGLNLFFNSDGSSYDPASGDGIPGDLAAFVQPGGTSFSIPAASTDVQSYTASGPVAPTTSYSGATSFQVAGDTITLSAFSSTAAPSGSFTLTVTPNSVAVPEPASLALLGTALAGLGLARRRKAG